MGALFERLLGLTNGLLKFVHLRSQVGDRACCRSRRRSGRRGLVSAREAGERPASPRMRARWGKRVFQQRGRLDCCPPRQWSGLLGCCLGGSHRERLCDFRALLSQMCRCAGSGCQRRKAAGMPCCGIAHRV